MTDTEFEKLDAQARRYLQRVPQLCCLKRKARASLSSDRPRSLKSVIVVRPPALPSYWK